MAKTKQMMETDEKGIKRQFFPVTHAGAVLGLKEFLEGDFFQADFDRVMALLEERSDKAFAEIDKKSDAMEKHADEKINEFDNKIAATNQTLATLEKEIYDTQQTFEKMDVYTKAETDANVIYQLIGKEKVRITLTLDLNNKIANSLTENPNVVKATAWQELIPISGGGELNQTEYGQFEALDSVLYKGSTSVEGKMIQVLHVYDLLSVLKNNLSEDFFIDRGATTLEKQVDVIKNITKKSVVSTFGFSSNVLNLKTWAWNQWNGDISSDANQTKELNHYISSSYIQNDGKVYVLVYSNPAVSSKSSNVNIDYSKLTVDIEISMNEHIKSMMAAYHRENEKYTFEKVGEV